MNIMTINFVYCKQLDARDEINRKARDRPGRKRTKTQILLLQLTTRYVNCLGEDSPFSFPYITRSIFCSNGLMYVDYFIIITPYKDDNWFRLYTIDFLSWEIFQDITFCHTIMMIDPKGNRSNSLKILSKTIMSFE